MQNCDVNNDWCLVLLVVNGKETKVSKIVYTVMLKGQIKVMYDFKWIRCMF